jgi:hypothetical protein
MPFYVKPVLFLSECYGTVDVREFLVTVPSFHRVPGVILVTTSI